MAFYGSGDGLGPAHMIVENYAAGSALPERRHHFLLLHAICLEEATTANMQAATPRRWMVLVRRAVLHGKGGNTLPGKPSERQRVECIYSSCAHASRALITFLFPVLSRTGVNGACHLAVG